MAPGLFLVSGSGGRGGPFSGLWWWLVPGGSWLVVGGGVVVRGGGGWSLVGGWWWLLGLRGDVLASSGAPRRAFSSTKRLGSWICWPLTAPCCSQGALPKDGF